MLGKSCCSSSLETTVSFYSACQPADVIDSPQGIMIINIEIAFILVELNRKAFAHTPGLELVAYGCYPFLDKRYTLINLLMDL